MGTEQIYVYPDTDSFVIHIITEDFYKDIANDLTHGLTHQLWWELWKTSSNRQEQRQEVIGCFKDELGGKNMKEFVWLRAKTYAYLIDNDSQNNKAKGTKKCVIKRRLTFENFKYCLFNNKIILKSQQRFKKWPLCGVHRRSQ